MSAEVATIRLDKWLWQARFCKTRGEAARLITSGSIRLNSVRVVKPATPVRPGDGLTMVRDSTVLVVRICALGLRRGPAPEASTLYVSLIDPQAAPTKDRRTSSAPGPGGT